MDAVVYRTLFATQSSSRHTPYTKTSPMTMSSYFFRLPAELKLEVVDYLDDKRDLYNTSKACRWLEDVVLKHLYASIDIEIPSLESPAWNTAKYLDLRPHVVKAIRQIVVRDQLEEHTKSCPSDQSTAAVTSPEAYVARLIAQMFSNQLNSFAFMHRAPLTAATLRLLSERSWQSLRHFSCYELDIPESGPFVALANLESLECRSIGNGHALGRLVQANKSTLKTLRLGEEKRLVREYIVNESGRLPHSPLPLTVLKGYVDLSEIQDLRQLCLTGLDLTPVVPLDVEGAMYLTRLQDLTMESCVGTPAFLSAMTGIFTFVHSEAAPDPKPLPLLRKFLLRQEVCSIDLKDSLLRFLNSFSGLRTLSLLFENGHISTKPADLITNHGSTLEQLVLESRIQPRQSLHLDTSRPFGAGGFSSQIWDQSINDICRLCPDLSELGMWFPWNDEVIRLRPSLLSSLTSLRTIHVRNFPESSSLSQMGDYTIREHAVKFMEWTFGNVHGDKPQLETLSIGPAIYESRFKGSNPKRKQVPNFLRTHHFTLDWATTRFGRWSPMITGVSEKYMEETRHEKPLSGIFEQVWLK